MSQERPACEGSTAQTPNRCWVADFIHVAAFAGVVYVAFVVDVYSRAIVGWSAATTKHTTLVLDALDMGLWRRDRDGRPVEAGLIHHSDVAQYTSFRFTTHLVDAGIDASIGSVGDALVTARRRRCAPRKARRDALDARRILDTIR